MKDISALQSHEGWTPELIEELQSNLENGRVGKTLVSETDRVRVWHLDIGPGERFGFHCHVLDYFWTSLSNGTARSRYDDGRIAEVRYSTGDTKHLKFARGERSWHDLENVGSDTLRFVTVEFKNGGNEPLPL